MRKEKIRKIDSDLFYGIIGFIALLLLALALYLTITYYCSQRTRRNTNNSDSIHKIRSNLQEIDHNHNLNIVIDIYYDRYYNIYDMYI